MIKFLRARVLDKGPEGGLRVGPGSRVIRASPRKLGKAVLTMGRDDVSDVIVAVAWDLSSLTTRLVGDISGWRFSLGRRKVVAGPGAGPEAGTDSW